MGLMADLGRGPVAIDTAIFIYFIEEHPKFLPLINVPSVALKRIIRIADPPAELGSPTDFAASAANAGFGTVPQPRVQMSP